MAGQSGSPITVLRSTIFEETPWAITDILPSGVNTPFTGIPSPRMHGADSVAVILDDFTIPGLNRPVVASIELIFLNERNIFPLNLGGDLYDFYFTLNPAKKSLGTLTVIQTRDDDRTPAPHGIFLRQTTLELLALLVPRARGDIVVAEATVPIASTVPIPFSFNPAPNMFVLKGKVGDVSVNWHDDKLPMQRNFFIHEGLLQVPLGGQSLFDTQGIHAARGGSVMALQSIGVPRDEKGLPRSMHHPGAANFGEIPPFYNNMLAESATTSSGGGGAVEYNASSGNLRALTSGGIKLTAINISSSSGIFSKERSASLSGELDRQTETQIFKLGIGESFDNIDFGPVARAGLTSEFLLNDLSARVLLADNTPRSRLRLIHIDG